MVTPIRENCRPHSTLRASHWQALLQDYPDRQFPQLLAGIATYGARAGYEGPYIRIRGKNHASAFRISQDITANIQSEIRDGRVKEVDNLPPYYFISPLGAVEKKSSGRRTGWRRIHDLSYPIASSVNDGIPEIYGTLQYQTLDDAIQLIATHGRNAILRKRDLQDAFRMIPLSPYDYWLFLFEWEGKLYMDIFLPFGLRTSPFIFNLFAEGLHWILEQVFDRQLVHYLDDFLLVNDPDPEFFGTLAQYLGLMEKKQKREDGEQVSFLGIELDSYAMEARLPKDKLDRALSNVHQLLIKGAASHRSLEKLLGFLSFCARVIPLGRPFLRNLFNFLRRLSYLHPHAISRLSSTARRDLHWWAILLPHWCGIRFINPSRQRITVYTDASGVKGIGGWCGKDAFSARIPRAHRKKLIDWKEAYAILFAFAKWGGGWKGRSVLIMCDNEALVASINNRSIRSKAIDPLQLIFLAAALDDIDICSMWLSSKDNWVADALSRFQFEKIADLFPQFQDTSQRRRQTGNPISDLRARLQTYYGMASIPKLETPTTCPSQSTAATQPYIKSQPSQQASKHSLNGLPKPFRKRRRLQRKTI